MKNNHGDTEDTELHEEETRENIKSISSPCFLCDLCASAVKILQCPIILEGIENE